MLASKLSGIGYSISFHGPHIFLDAKDAAIKEKIEHARFIRCISYFCRSQLIVLSESSNLSTYKIVHCGLEPSFFDAPASYAPHAKRFVCVGRLCEQKGQLLLIEAAQRLALQGVEFELVLVGDGEMRSDIEALIRRHKLQDKVRITGWLSNEQVRDEILAARALVLPSFAEGLPVVIMEAMALRRPVISTFVAGIPELVHTGEHGWLVPAGDAEALLHAMQACLDAPTETLTSMGEAARKRVVERHSVETEAAKLAKLFELHSHT
jgi:glycosyltransferase involved in cell wall biosynthesis